MQSNSTSAIKEENTNVAGGSGQIILDIDMENLRSIMYASTALVSWLTNDNFEKLLEIETSSGCKIQLPHVNRSNDANERHTEVPVALTGSVSAINQAVDILEDLNDKYKVVYLPLDEKETAAVALDSFQDLTGCQVRVLTDSCAGENQLELLGESEKVATASAVLDVLLHRQLFDLDEISTAFLMEGDHIERIQAEHPKVIVDLLPHCQVVRLKGKTKNERHDCVSKIGLCLYLATFIETIELPVDGHYNLNELLAEPLVALYLMQLEARARVKSTIESNGTQVKIRGDPSQIAMVKKFFEMLIDETQPCLISFPLSADVHAKSLQGTKEGLNENVFDIVKETKSVIRIKADTSSPSGFAVSITGPSFPRVLDAKQRIECFLELQFPDHIKYVHTSSKAATKYLVAHYSVFAYNATTSLVDSNTIRIIADSKESIDREFVYRTRYEELSIPRYIAPLLEQNNRKILKKLSAESHTHLTLAPAIYDEDNRVMLINSDVPSHVSSAISLVEAFIKAFEDESVTVAVPIDFLERALGLQTKDAQGISLIVVAKNEATATLKIHAKHRDDRQAVVARIKDLTKGENGRGMERYELSNHQLAREWLMETETAVGGEQETPSQWRHGGTQEAVQERVETLVLCSFDEDETQIRFLSNCLSQEECGPRTLQERKLLHVQTFNGDEGDGDDEDSGNESEDMWVGGTDLLAQWSSDVQKVHERESQVLADLPQWNASAPLQEHSTSSDVDTNVSEDEDMATQTNSAMLDGTQSIGSSISAQTQAISLSDKTQINSIASENMQDSPNTMQRLPNPPSSNDMDQERAISLEIAHEEAIASEKTQEMTAAIAPPPTKKRKKTPASEEIKPKTKAKRTARAAYCESEDFNESQPRVSKRAQKINESESMSQASSISSTQDVISTIRIVLTGIEPTPSILRKIKAIKGAVFEEDVTKGTHLVAPENQLKRTVKMLCGISCCLHVLDETWLHTSSKMRRPANEYDFCLNDMDKQKQWGFELKDTMYKHSLEDRRVFLQAYSFYITPHKSLRPPPADLEKIIVCAGGQVVKSPSANSIVISSPEAMATKATLKKVGANRPVYTPELLLLGVLKQSLDFEAHRLIL